MTMDSLDQVIFPFVTVCFAALHVLAPLGLAAQALILAPSVVVLGLPHGALDLAMGDRLWGLTSGGMRGILRVATFILVYVTLAILVLGLWLWQPGPALALFLAYSVYHFSGDWDGWGPLWRGAGGLATVGAPALFHPAQVEAIFSLVAPASSVAIITVILGGVGIFAVTLTAVALLRCKMPARIVEHLTLWGCAFVLPPFLFFIVYFCFLHSWRHMRNTLARLPNLRLASWSCATVTGITLIGAVIAWNLLPSDASITGRVTSIVFIGLACLTVPHMLLVDLWEDDGRGLDKMSF